MVVEDEYALRYFYRLSLTGYRMLEARDAHEASQVLNDEKVDMIILDIMLPNIDGLDFLRTLKSGIATSGIPVLVVTAKTDVSEKIFGLGAEGLIYKPFEPDKLIKKVKSIVGVRNEKAK